MKKAATTHETLWDNIALGRDAELEANLAAIAMDLAGETPRHFGVTVGEVVKLAEERGLKVGGAVLTDKQLEERQTSWLPKVMRRAGLEATDRMRPSPVPRHKGRRQVVWIRPVEKSVDNRVEKSDPCGKPSSFPREDGSEDTMLYE